MGRGLVITGDKLLESRYLLRELKGAEEGRLLPICAHAIETLVRGSCLLEQMILLGEIPHVK